MIRLAEQLFSKPINKVSAIFMLLFSTSIYSSPAAYHLLTNISYDNPANLNMVQDAEIILGGTYINPVIKYRGTNGTLSGSVRSSEANIIPYGRIAKRINSKLVLDVDVSSTSYTNIRFPTSAFTSALATRTIIHSFDISPRLSYQVTPTTAVGAGVIFDRVYDSQLGYVVPPNELINTGIDWAYGWTVGVSHAFSKSTIANFSYVSRLNHYPKGTSEWGASRTKTKFNFLIPAVFTANVVHFASPKLLFSATARYLQWERQNALFIDNTAVNGTNYNFTLNYNNSWSGQIASRYQLLEKLGVSGTVIYESSAQGTAYRPIGLPTYRVWILGVGADYGFTKSLIGKLVFGHGISRPPIDTTGPLGTVKGSMDNYANLLDFSLTYKI